MTPKKIIRNILVLGVIILMATNFSRLQISTNISSGESSLSHPLNSSDPSEFISVWNTSITSSGSSANNQIKLPLTSSGKYNFVVGWGDGQNDTITAYNQTAQTHTYQSAGVYTITITGMLDGWEFNGGDCKKLLEISQWGTIDLGNSGNYFNGCSNLNLTATDNLNLTGTTDLSTAFNGCAKLGNSGNMDGWNVSKVTDMNNMFNGASTFNQPIGNWNVSSVIDMSYMFFGATAFNQPIGNWNVSNVESMDDMFNDATAFNQPIGNWSVSNVESMDDMFLFDVAFNQPIGNWNVSSVIDMDSIFYFAESFNQPIGNWDVSSVTDMQNMFSEDYAFNQNIGNWNVSRVTIMNSMLDDAVRFSTINYDSLLEGWAQLNLQNGVYFSARYTEYLPGNASKARQYIIDTFNWTITDGGVATPPGIPSNLQVTPGDKQIYLSWDAPYDTGGLDITGYNIYRGTTPGTETFLTTMTNFSIYTNLCYYTDTGLANGTTYYYKITTLNLAGEGNQSSECSATTFGVPNAQIDLQIFPGDKQITLNWQYPSNGGGTPIIGFKIYRGTASGAETLLITVGDVQTFTDMNLQSNTTYYYKVSAINLMGEGPQSSEVSAVPNRTTQSTTTYNSVGGMSVGAIISVGLVGVVTEIIIIRKHLKKPLNILLK